ncbi:hypothetical protein NDU88_002739 [Pleurodeles waltl]|uniref:Uncharacterized protein n=1 Tax=Pleurodeles waltl TaxID=8319 RepID=A0AAV7W063_PLEWA|nr:hypothetical protein NDU88_002739 [Pleurodeles waltl]
MGVVRVARLGHVLSEVAYSEGARTRSAATSARSVHKDNMRPLWERPWLADEDFPPPSTGRFKALTRAIPRSGGMEDMVSHSA